MAVFSHPQRCDVVCGSGRVRPVLFNFSQYSRTCLVWRHGRANVHTWPRHCVQSSAVVVTQITVVGKGT